MSNPPLSRPIHTSARQPAPRLTRLALHLACAAIVPTLPVGAAFAQPVQAGQEAQRHSIDIAPGRLSAVLGTYAAQAGVHLSADGALTQGLQSDGLKGRYGVAEGFARLLSQHELQALPNGDGSYTLATLPRAAGEATLTAVTVTASSLNNATSEGTGSYAARGASLMRNVQSLKEIPQSLTVVTRKRLDDQNLSSLSEVLENTTGVTISEVADGGRNYLSRGFRIRNIQYDGLPLSRSFYGVGNSYTESTSHLDRVEVLRGAAGLFEGSGQPGGSVNLVRKRATADTQVSVETRAGSWSHFGAMLDVGGALNADGSLRARAVLDHGTKESFIDVVEESNTNAYLALDYDLSPRTTLGVGILISRLRATPFFGGLPRYSDGSSIDLSRSTFLGANWNRWDRDETQLFADLTHQFNSDWRLKIAAAYVEEDSITLISDAAGAVHPDTLTGTTRTAWDYDKSSKHFGFDANLQGRFTALGMEQNLVVGVNMSRLKTTDSIAYAFDYQTVDVFNPDSYVTKPGSFPDSQRLSRYAPHEQKGIYAQLRSSLTDDLILITGGRFSWFESRFTTRATTWSSASQSDADAEFSPFLGLVYNLTPQWSIYGSYADIFEPQTATSVNGSVLKPIVGTNYEAGIKGELMGGRLNTSFAVYRIDQENRAVNDYASGRVCGGNYCSRAAGEVRSQGFELEASGEAIPGLQLAAGYTFNSNKYRRDPEMQGKTFNDETPRHLLRIWSDYRLPGQLADLRLGAGVNWQSELTNNVSGVRRPSYSVWNARIGYDLKPHWTLALNINNVFDKTYYEAAGYVENRNNYGPPRNFLLTLRGQF